MARSELVDDQSFSIPCPQCGHETDKTVGWIKANDNFTCAGCTGNVTLNRDEILRKLREADKLVSDFKRQFL